MSNNDDDGNNDKKMNINNDDDDSNIKSSSYRSFFECFPQSSSCSTSSSTTRTAVDEEISFAELLKSKYIQHDEDEMKQEDDTNESLKNAKVIRIWNIRPCSNTTTTTNSNNNTNGPLARVYSVVTSMEVYDPHTFQNILVYFYNEYATLVNQHTDSSSSGSNNNNNNNNNNTVVTFLSLNRIPKKCFFETTNKYKNNVALGDCPFCICIGDASKARLSNTIGSTSSTRMRFDTVHFSMTLLSTAADVVTLQTIQHEQQQEKNDITFYNSVHISNNGGDHLAATCTSKDCTINKLSSATTASSARTSRVTHYTYSSLNDIIQLLKKGPPTQEFVNVYGVVTHFTSPAISKRKGEYYISVTLIDETTTTSSSVVVMNTFASSFDKLPKFTKVGDVLRAHRMKVQEWNGTVQLVGNSKVHSSFITFREQQQQNDTRKKWEINSTAEKMYTFTIKDYDRCCQLWKWGQYQLSYYPYYFHQQDNNNNALSISSFDATTTTTAETIYGDLIAMITAIVPCKKENTTATTRATPSGCLRLWDGTGPSLSDPPVFKDTAYSDAVSPGNDPPLEALVSIAKIIKMNQNLLKHKRNDINNDCFLDDEVDSINKNSISQDEEDSFLLIKQPPLATCGKVVNCLIWQETQWNLLTQGVSSSVYSPSDTSNEDGATNNNFTGGINVGQFIRLRNVNGGVHGSIPCLHVHDKSSCTPFMDTMFDIRRILLNHQKRLERVPPDEHNINSAILPARLLQELMTTTTASSSSLHSPQLTVLNTAALPLKKRAHHYCAESGSSDELYYLLQCLGEPAPASFSVPVSVIGINPNMDSSSLPIDCSKLCARPRCRVYTSNSGISSNSNSENTEVSPVFHFTLRLQDNTAELDAIVHNALAESLLGLTAAQILVCHNAGSSLQDEDYINNNNDNDKARKINTAVESKLKEITSRGKLFLAHIKSMRLGKSTLYILESLDSITSKNTHPSQKYAPLV